jgi:hypothetical protein
MKNDVNVPVFRIRVRIRRIRMLFLSLRVRNTACKSSCDGEMVRYSINQPINQSIILLCFVGAGGGYGGGAGYAGYGGGADASCGRGAAGQRGTGAGAGYGNFWTGAGVGGLLGTSGLCLQQRVRSFCIRPNCKLPGY